MHVIKGGMHHPKNGFNVILCDSNKKNQTLFFPFQVECDYLKSKISLIRSFHSTTTTLTILQVQICIITRTLILWLWCLVIFYSNVASSFHGAFTFSPPLFSPCNIDPSNDLDHENHMNEDVPTLETYLHVVYSKLVGIKKGNYNAIKMFQDFRVAKLPWT